MNGKSAPGCSSAGPLEVRVAEEHGKQKSAFFTSFVKRRTQYNNTSKVTIKREEVEEEEKDQGCNSIDIWNFGCKNGHQTRPSKGQFHY